MTTNVGGQKSENLEFAEKLGKKIVRNAVGAQAGGRDDSKNGAFDIENFPLTLPHSVRSARKPSKFGYNPDFSPKNDEDAAGAGGGETDQDFRSDRKYGFGVAPIGLKFSG